MAQRTQLAAWRGQLACLAWCLGIIATATPSTVEVRQEPSVPGLRRSSGAYSDWSTYQYNDTYRPGGCRQRLGRHSEVSECCQKGRTKVVSTAIRQERRPVNNGNNTRRICRRLFNKERKRHFHAQEQFEKDIVVAMEKQEEARMNIRTYAARMASGGMTAAVEDEGPSWEDLTRSWIAEEEGAMEGVLHRALGSQGNEPRTPSIRRPAAARTPDVRRGVPDRTYAAEELTTARTDPYPPVPSPPATVGPPGLSMPEEDVDMAATRMREDNHRHDLRPSPNQSWPTRPFGTTCSHRRSSTQAGCQVSHKADRRQCSVAFAVGAKAGGQAVGDEAIRRTRASLSPGRHGARSRPSYCRSRYLQ